MDGKRRQPKTTPFESTAAPFQPIWQPPILLSSAAQYG